MRSYRFITLALCVLGVSSAQAASMVSYNGDYVTANVNCQGLSGGQVPWSMSSPRSPSASYTGPVFYGGVSGTESIAQWRVANGSPDYVNTQDSSAAAGAFIHQAVMFTNETAQSWTGAVIRVGGYDYSGTTNWYRFVARDAGGSFYISAAAHIGADVSRTQDVTALSWYGYDPATSISTVGSSASWSPTNVTAVGLFQGSENMDSVAQGLGSKLYVFEAYDGQSSAGPYTLTIAPNNGLWGSVSPTGGVYESGSNVQITATASNHYHFVNWSGSVSSTNAVTNVLMTANKSVTANFAADQHTLAVFSAHGTPVPSGTVTNNYGSVLTNTVDSPIAAGLTQYVCTGWTLTGNSPVSGTTNTCVLTLTNNAALTWLWQTNVSTLPSMGRGPASLAFTHYVESNAPAAQSFYVTNIAAGQLHVSNAWNVSWLDITPLDASGIGSGAAQEFLVSILPAGLALGVSNAVITINSTNADNGPLTVSVQLTVLSTQTFGAASTDWPVYGGNSNRDFYSEQTLTQPLAKGWVYKMQKPQTAFEEITTEAKQSNAKFYPVQYDRAPSSIAVGDRLYLSSSTEEAVFCLDAKTGTNVWRFHAEGAVRLAPAYDNGKIYFGSDDGYAYCLNAEDGALIWKAYGASNTPHLAAINGRLSSAWPVRTGVTVEDGKAYFGAGVLAPQGSYLNCVDANNGSLIWRKAVNYSLQGYIMPLGDKLYVGTGRTAPMEYSKADGTPFYPVQGGNRNREGGGVSLSVMDGFLTYGPSENGITCVRMTANATTAYFSNNTTRIPGSMAYISAQRIMTDGNNYYFLHVDELPIRRNLPNSILAVSRSFATNSMWNSVNDFTTNRMPRSAGIYWHNGADKIGAECSEPILMNEIISNCVWKLTNSAPISAGLLTPNALYAGGVNVLNAYNPADGSLLWTAAVTGEVFELTLANGALYAGTDEGYVYCFSNGAPGTVDEGAPLYASPYPTNDLNYSIYAEAASLAITNADTTKGYCLVLGAGEGRLAYEIAKRSDFMVVGLETDSAKAATARANLMQAGLYGSRVVIHEDMDELFPHPDYFANLIVSEELLMDGTMPYSSQEIFRMLQPYGGTVLFGNVDGNLDLTSWVGASMSVWSDVGSANGITWKIARRGEPSGFGSWPFQMGGPGNTLCSGDQLVGTNLVMQWIYPMSPAYTGDRHLIAASPIAASGRMAYLGNDHLVMMDGYNGTVIWELDVPGSMCKCAPLDAPMMCFAGDRLYAAGTNGCRVFDAQTGTSLGEFQGPLSAYDWGYVGVYSNILFGSNQKAGSSVGFTGDIADLYQSGAGGSWPIVSANFFAKNPTNGAELWNYTNGVVLNSTITLGGTNVFFAVSRNSTAMNDADGRVALTDFFASDAYLVALDMVTGSTVWEQPLSRWAGSDAEQAFFLSYAPGRLLTAGSLWVGADVNSARYYLTVRNAADGSQIGSTIQSALGPGGVNETDHNGVLMRPVIVGSKAYHRIYKAKSLLCIDLSNASTSTVSFVGAATQKGCTPPSASSSAFYYRAYSIEALDLASGKVADLTASTRPSCWPSILPVGGVLLMPEGSAGCDCGMAYQTSMAMAPVVNDTDPPGLFNVVALDDNTVIAVFDEAVSVSTATNLNNYSLDNGITVTAAERQTNHLERVTLTVSTMPGGTNTLTVVNVKDLHGNAMGSEQMSFESGAADTDSDGLPDSWEQQYFGSPTGAVPSADSDNDGLSNYDEYIAGTDPTDPFSLLLVDSIIPAAGSGYIVTWTPQEGRTYNVLWTDKLTTNFTTLVTGLAYPQSRWTDTLHSAEADGFYRIEAVK